MSSMEKQRKMGMVSVLRDDPFLKSFYAAKYFLFQYLLFTYFAQTIYETFGAFLEYSLCLIFEIIYTLGYVYLVSGLISRTSVKILRNARHALIFSELFIVLCFIFIFIIALASNTQGDGIALLLWGSIFLAFLFGVSLIFSLIPFRNE